MGVGHLFVLGVLLLLLVQPLVLTGRNQGFGLFGGLSIYFSGVELLVIFWPFLPSPDSLLRMIGMVCRPASGNSETGMGGGRC